MKKVKTRSKNIRKTSVKSPRKSTQPSRFTLFTILFILAALILTVFAVQQQQNLVQDAARKEECPTETELSREDRQATRAARQDDGENSEEDEMQAEAADDTELSREDRQATRAARREDGDNDEEEPTPTCKPKENRNNGDRGNGGDRDNQDNKEREKKDREERERRDRENSRRNNNGWDPNRLGCNLFPSLPYCSRNGGGNNSGGNPCPSDNNNGGRRGGSGRDGQENESNNPGTVTIGEINDDETSNTRIIINGKEVTNDGQTFRDGGTTNLGDINTGGKQGGNNSTVIEIDESGTDDYDDQSGSDGNGRGNGNAGGNGDDCMGRDGGNGKGNGGNAQANADGGKKGNNNGNGNNSTNGNGGRNSGLFCNIMPWLLWCR